MPKQPIREKLLINTLCLVCRFFHFLRMNPHDVFECFIALSGTIAELCGQCPKCSVIHAASELPCNTISRVVKASEYKKHEQTLN